MVEYEKKANQVINFQVPQEPQEIVQKRENVKQLQTGFNQLLIELEKVNIKTKYQAYKETPKSANTQPSSQYTYTEKKVEPPRQQVSAPPPPPRQETTRKVEPPRQEVSTPPPNPAELEAKFRAWELDEEIAQMKANMNSAGKQEPKNQKAQNTPKTQAEKDKIIRAYQILGLQPTASFAEVKQAYKTLVKKWHPDLFVNQPQMQKQVQEKMRLVNEAYNILNANNG